MTKHFNLARISVALLLIPLLALAKISDKRKCFNEDCSEVVSLGKTLVRYVSKDPDLLSFPANSDVRIYSKEAGNRLDLWGVEINNERGYVPKQFIRENQILQSKLEYIVPTNLPSENDGQNLPEPAASIPSNRSENDKAIPETPVAEAALPQEKNLEFFDPIFVTPSYESYDGIILPADSENVSVITVQTNGQTADSSAQVDPLAPTPSGNILVQATMITENLVDHAPEFGKTDYKPASQILDDTTIFGADMVDAVVPEELAAENVTLEEVLSTVETTLTETASADEVSQTVDTSVVEISPTVETTTTGEVLPTVTNTVEVVEIKPTAAIEKQIQVSIPAPEVAPEVEETLQTIEDPIVPSPEIAKEINLLIEDDPVAEPPLESGVSAEINDSIEDAPLNTAIPEGFNFDNSTEDLSYNVTEELTYDETMENLTSTLDESDTGSDFSATSIENNQIEANDTIAEILIPQEELLHVSEATRNVPEQLDFEMFHRSLLSAADSIGQAPNIPESEIYESQVAAIGQAPNVPESDIIESQASAEPGEPLQEDMTSKTTEPSVETSSSEISAVPEELSSFDVKITTTTIADETPVPSEPEMPPQSFDAQIIVPPVEPVKIPVSPKMDVPEPTDEKAENIQHLSENVCHSDECPSSVQEIEKDESYTDTIVANLKNLDGTSNSLRYMVLTAVTVLFFSLGYYFIESRRQDAVWIGKINKLEKELMVTRKENMLLNESVQSATKEKLDAVDGSAWKDEVEALKKELLSSEQARTELEESNAALVKELDLAEETVLETHRLMNDSISSHTAALSELEDMQKLLSVKQTENESLSKVIAAKKAEIEKATVAIIEWKKKYEKLETENKHLSEELTTLNNKKNHMEQQMIDQMQRLETQIKTINEEKKLLNKKLKKKELEFDELSNNIAHFKLNESDVKNLYEVSRIKAESQLAVQERDELQSKLDEMERTHQELEGHVASIREAAADLTEQCAIAESEKKKAEARLEVLEEKEFQRQQDERTLLQTQGEVASTIEKLQVMQKDIDHYKQQMAILKREIVAQEKYYKEQIKDQENKAHDQWMLARNNERRLQEFKAESSELRSRLSLMEKNSTEVDPDLKAHRKPEETAASPPPFIGVDNSSSPAIFPPGPPPYLYGPGFPSSFVPPPPISGNMAPLSMEAGQRPPPLGGRLSSPPPVPLPPSLTSPGRFDNMNSQGSPMSPPPPNMSHRIPPPLPPPHMPTFGPDGYHHNHLIHAPLPLPRVPMSATHHNTWGDHHTPPTRNSGYHHSHQRDQRTRNNEEPLHSSRESLDRSYSDV